MLVLFIERSPKQMFQTSHLLDVFLYFHSAFQNDDNRIVFHNSNIAKCIIATESIAYTKRCFFKTLLVCGLILDFFSKVYATIFPSPNFIFVTALISCCLSYNAWGRLRFR